MNKFSAIIACSFLSGAAALLYQLLWFKQIHLILGVAYVSLASVLSVFLLGLLIGSFLGGKFAQNTSLNVARKSYIFIELGIGAIAFLVPLAMKWSTPLLSYSYNMLSSYFLVIQILVTFFILIIPCILIGATVPFLFRLYSTDRQNIKTDFSKLYYSNALGGMFGVLLCGFILIRFFGVNFALLIGILFNIVAALIMFKLHLHNDSLPQENSLVNVTPRSILFLFFSTGFISFGLEILWTRILAINYFSTIYQTTLIIATILLAFFSGSLFFKRYYNNFDLRTFAFIQIVALISLISGFLIYLNLPTQFFSGFGANVFILFLACFILTFIPSFCFGMSFPLLISYSLSHISTLEYSLGKFYSVNLFGSMLGALLTGFILIPLFGMKYSLIIFASYLIILALISGLTKCRSGIWLIGISTLLMFFIILSSNLFLPSSFDDNSELLYYSEGKSATVSLISYFDEYRTIKKLYVDGQPVASDSSVSLLDSRVLAHIPLILHKSPHNALTVGFGSGGTSRAMLLHDLDYVDVVEIEPAVIGAYSYFSEINGDLLKDHRLNVIIDDARSYLTLTNKTYDVISTDVTNIRYASNSNLYTTDYFKIIKSKLNEGGVVAVWVPAFDIDSTDQKVLLASFAQVFPYVSVWYPYHKLSNYYVFIGSEEVVYLNYTRIMSSFEDVKLSSDLSLVDLTPEKFVSSLFLDDSSARDYVQGYNVHTDNLPVLSFPDLFPTVESFTPADNLGEVFLHKIDPLKYVIFESIEHNQEFTISLRHEEENFLKPILVAHIAYLNKDYGLAGRIYSQLFPDSQQLLNALP
ncbi:MAG: fused MFS/spermidine synthase [Candidatus Pacearchaeota archaeon]